MIFEVNYSDIQAPLAVIKELLTDKEYKGDVKAVTIEVTKESVFLHFHDNRLGIRIKARLNDADAQLPGTATCSFASFLEVVKVFKKSDEPLLIEREGDFLRVDDGVYPEEMMPVREDASTPTFPDLNAGSEWLEMEAQAFGDSLQLASVMVKKSDLPAEMVDTQAVYMGTKGNQVSFSAFSLYNFQRSKRTAGVYRESLKHLPKMVASSLSKVALSGKKAYPTWTISEVEGEEDEDKGILLEDGNRLFSLFVTLPEASNASDLDGAYQTLEQNFHISLLNEECLHITDVVSMGKIKADDNCIIEDGVCKLNPTGYPAQHLRKLWEKGACDIYFYSDGGQGAQPAICLYNKDEDGEKMTVLSYRGQASA